MAGNVPVYNKWTLNLSGLLSGLYLAGNQLFSTLEVPSASANNVFYTINNFNCGWEKNNEGNYKFNISDLKLNAPKLEDDQIFFEPLGVSGALSEGTKFSLWADKGKFTQNLSGIISESVSSGSLSEILTDIKNETYYILLEKK